MSHAMSTTVDLRAEPKQDNLARKAASEIRAFLLKVKHGGCAAAKGEEAVSTTPAKGAKAAGDPDLRLEERDPTAGK